MALHAIASTDAASEAGRKSKVQGPQASLGRVADLRRAASALDGASERRLSLRHLQDPGTVCAYRAVMRATMPLLIGAAIAWSSCGPVNTAQRNLDRELGRSKSCVEGALDTDAGRFFQARFYTGERDGGVTTKLRDETFLTDTEARQLLAYRQRVLPCRRIILDASQSYAPNDVPAWATLFARGDEVVTRVAGREITVGAANRYSMQAMALFEKDIAEAFAMTNRENRALTEQRRREALGFLEYSSRMYEATAPSIPSRMSCNWVGPTLQCLGN